MTLHSKIRLTTSVDPFELLDKLTVACGGNPVTAKRFDTRKPVESWHRADPDHVEIGNELGQGFAAIIDVTFRPDGEALYMDSEDHDTESVAWNEKYYAEHPEDEREEYDWEPAPAGVMQVDLDTAYSGNCELIEFDGTRTGKHLGCSGLHLWLAHLIEQEYGTVVYFYNEFNGTWGTLEDQFEGMAEGNSNAMDWYHNKVLPLITSGGRNLLTPA